MRPARAWNFKDITGQEFGRLKAIRLSRVVGKIAYWLCQCRCGKECETQGSSLRNKGVKSCGCATKEATVKHGMYDAPGYRSWYSMIDRCTDKTAKDYPRYGGKGVNVCERWLGLEGIKNFFADMGPQPTPKHSIDRFPNKNGNYEPGNCRWATRFEQQRNKNNNRLLTHNGETKTMAEWAESLGLHLTAMAERFRRGWSVEKAVTTPKMRKRVCRPLRNSLTCFAE